ncbi:hypothetical protein SAMN04487819_108252 [Actinopolyspora alba]|uniref:Uncharacterized protein n=1 Tax=Actinopolyspora alba TaxID=673379 RepID=A0A1I1Y976_9ACTN|nr:hypothetical protein [Actinopolyspora alba]SFE15892.1 hypothetical protein SAMN04487819_108252 [Actinopolyspora alba]
MAEEISVELDCEPEQVADFANTVWMMMRTAGISGTVHINDVKLDPQWVWDGYNTDTWQDG